MPPNPEGPPIPPIQHAADQNDKRVVKPATDQAQSVDEDDQEWHTVAITASKVGDVQQLQLLRDQGASLSLADDAGRSLVHEAAEAGQLQVLQYLADLGLPLDDPDVHGLLPVDVARGDAARSFLAAETARVSSRTGRIANARRQRQQQQQGEHHTNTPGSDDDDDDDDDDDEDEPGKPDMAGGSASGSSHSGRADRGLQGGGRKPARGGRQAPAGGRERDISCRRAGLRGAMSHKAKKEYLQWKRAQKRADAADKDDSSDWQPEDAAATARLQHPAAVAAPGVRSGGKPAGIAGAVPVRGAHDASQAKARVLDDGLPARVPNRERLQPDMTPVHYVQLEDLPAAEDADHAAPGLPAKMARCVPEEVGFTPEGLALGMPKRPAWRGIVKSAEELHALEEQAFQSWKDSLGQAVTDDRRISFYESRLEFWRQLWRVLELSDIALMIVDARNPLLHFSDALTQHVIHEQGKQALLVLNKCDLVPAAAIREWVQFFMMRYPGLRVVPASTAPSAGRGAAADIVDAVQGCSIRRCGVNMKVADFLQTSTSQILNEAQARNIIAKRGSRAAPATVSTAAPATAGASAGAAAPAAAASMHAPAAARHKQSSAGGVAEPVGHVAAEPSKGGSNTCNMLMEAEDSTDTEDEGLWVPKGTKAKKKQAVKKKREHRGHHAANQPTTGVSKVTAARAFNASGRNSKSSAASSKQQQEAGKGQQARSNKPAAADADADADAENASGRSAASSGYKPWQQQQQQQQHRLLQSDGDYSTIGSEDDDALTAGTLSEHGNDSGAESDEDNANGVLEALADDTFTDPDNRTESSELQQQQHQHQHQQGRRRQQQQQVPGRADPAAAASTTPSRVHPPAHTRDSHRPVIVCVVGEPNVGKSSTMNALLGTHKVAVSSHPGRTKHYQTHYMTSLLMLCDCPGLVFPRLDVSLPMQVLYGSYPIARCRDPYAVVHYLMERIWPRLHMTLSLRKVTEEGQPLEQQGDELQRAGLAGGGPAGSATDDAWSPLELCEAFAARKNWRSRRGGRLDVYRAANWILRLALAGKSGVALAFLPPKQCTAADGQQGTAGAGVRPGPVARAEEGDAAHVGALPGVKS